MEAEPDKYDRAALFQQWKGLNLRLNQMVVEQFDQHERMNEIAKRQDELDSRDALIGDLRHRLEELEKEHQANWAWIKERLKGK